MCYLPLLRAHYHPMIISGIFFFWQLGVLSYLDRQYDLSRISMTGASSGAVAVACTAANVEFADFVQMTITKCDEINLWERKLGVIGVLGQITKDTLERMLPEDSHEKLNESNVSVLIQPANPFRSVKRVTSFRSRRSVIDVLSATSHIPYLANGKAQTKYRGKSYFDGALFARPQDFVDEELSGVPVLQFDHSQDPALKDTNLIDCLKTPTKEQIWGLFYMGRKFAEHRDSLGDLACLTPLFSRRLSKLVSDQAVKAFSRNTQYRWAFAVLIALFFAVLPSNSFDHAKRRFSLSDEWVGPQLYSRVDDIVI